MYDYYYYYPRSRVEPDPNAVERWGLVPDSQVGLLKVGPHTAGLCVPSWFVIRIPLSTAYSLCLWPIACRHCSLYRIPTYNAIPYVYAYNYRIPYSVYLYQHKHIPTSLSLYLYLHPVQRPTPLHLPVRTPNPFLCEAPSGPTLPSVKRPTPRRLSAQPVTGPPVHPPSPAKGEPQKGNTPELTFKSRKSDLQVT